MIQYKDKTFEDYDINPVTAVITDKNGVVQKTYIINGRPMFKGMFVHCIMAHTFYGYKPEIDIHHLDEDKFNNALSNLVYLTRTEHLSLHHKGKPSPRKGIILSAETKAKLSAAMKGKHLSEETKKKISAANKGKIFSEEHKQKLSASHKGKTFYDTKITSRSVSIPDDLWIKIEEICEKKDMKISAYFRSILMKEFDGESK